MIYIGLTSVMHPVLLPGSRYTRAQVVVGHLLRCRMALLLTALGFLVREAWPPWAASASWKKWLREEKELKKNEINE